MIAWLWLWLGLCWAQDTVALIPPEAAVGTSSADLELLMRGIGGALRGDRRLDPLYDTDLASRLSEGREERLKEARDALAEGRRMLDTQDADIAMMFLEEAVAAHDDVGSPVARRAEAADAHYALARAYLALADLDQADAHLAETLRLVPDYLETRASITDPSVAASVQRALAIRKDKPPLRLSEAGAASLGVDLLASFLVHGVVDAAGELRLTIYEGPAAVHTLTRFAPFDPPPPGDDWYALIAEQIVAACLHKSIPADPKPPLTVSELPESPGNAVPTPTVVSAEPERPRKKGAWAIAVVGAVLVGGGVGAAVALTTPAPGEPSPVWTLTVETP